MQETVRSGSSGLVGPADGAEVFVAQLVASGVEVLYINSGTDTFPVQEAIAKRHALGLPSPRVVLCLDEMVAGAAAHGHFMVTGRPQAILVHVDVGTQQIGGAVHNAQRGHAGMLICAGRAPVTADGELPFGRSSYIHWIQEQLDQNGIVRNYTKWDYEVRRKENIGQVVQRGLQIAASAPAGPVYLTLPREPLQDTVDEVRICPPERFAPTPAPAPRPELIEAAARLLAEAHAPLIAVAASGQNPASVPHLVALAELIGAPVYTHGDRMCFPNDHPLWADAGDVTGAVGDCDVLLCIDIDVPYIPARGRPKPDAKVIWIAVDPVNASIPITGFPMDVAIPADSALALELLVGAVRQRVGGSRVQNEARRAAVEAANRTRQREYRAAALARADESPIHAPWLALALGEVFDDSWTVLDESVGTSAWVGRFIPHTRPTSLFKSGGSSLGWALGAALGAKIAQPERKVVAIVGDGTFVYGCPTASLWAADVQQAPYLVIIVNNRMHNATRNALRMGYPESYAEHHNDWPGIRIDPPPDYAALARASRAHGETVNEPAELRPALDRALAALERGQAAVVDVRVAEPR